MSEECDPDVRISQKGDRSMPRKQSTSHASRRPSTAQLVFLILTLVIILSFVLSLFVQV